MVIEEDTFLSWLPRSIEAVWYLKSWNCYSGGSMQCEGAARRVHEMLLREHGITSEQLPLLTFDPYNWNAPFAQVK